MYTHMCVYIYIYIYIYIACSLRSTTCCTACVRSYSIMQPAVYTRVYIALHLITESAPYKHTNDRIVSQRAIILTRAIVSQHAIILTVQTFCLDHLAT